MLGNRPRLSDEFAGGGRVGREDELRFRIAGRKGAASRGGTRLEQQWRALRRG
jgi:hypothetical protein